MQTAQIIHTTFNEYAIDANNVRQSVIFCKERTQKIASAGHYVGACRRWAARNNVDNEDGRLIVAGWNHFSPSRWMGEGMLADFKSYWARAAERTIVGSPYNAEMFRIFDGWRTNLAPFVLKVLGSAYYRAGQAWPETYLSDVQYARASVLLRKIGGDRKGLAQRKRQLVRAARCIRRSSMSECSMKLSPKVLAKLGRMSPELQAASISELEKTPRAIAGHLMLTSDIPWDRIAVHHRQFRKNPAMRIIWANGKRLADLEAKFGHPCTLTYPLAPPCLQRALLRGESPAECSKGELSPVEARQWLLGGARYTPSEWLSSALPQVDGLQILATDIEVARWMKKIHSTGQWGDFIRWHQVYRFGFTGRLQVEPHDISSAESTSVVHVFQQTYKRRMAERDSRGWN